MWFTARSHRSFALTTALLGLLSWVTPARAQVTDVTVGVTPTCPYGLAACWGGAYEALGRLEGVESVARSPDEYNCTARVHLKSEGLPDIARWETQFKDSVGQAYKFRGVEVSVRGTIESRDGGLVLIAAGQERPITLEPLRNKLQWNFRKGAARQPEPDELAAFDQLVARQQGARPGPLGILITGPIKRDAKGLALEVREYSVGTPGTDRRPND